MKTPELPPSVDRYGNEDIDTRHYLALVSVPISPLDNFLGVNKQQKPLLALWLIQRGKLTVGFADLVVPAAIAA